MKLYGSYSELEDHYVVWKVVGFHLDFGEFWPVKTLHSRDAAEDLAKRLNVEDHGEADNKTTMYQRVKTNPQKILDWDKKIRQMGWPWDLKENYPRPELEAKKSERQKFDDLVKELLTPKELKEFEAKGPVEIVDPAPLCICKWPAHDPSCKYCEPQFCTRYGPVPQADGASEETTELIVEPMNTRVLAQCMNAVRNHEQGGWYRCGFTGEVKSLEDECPSCLTSGRLAPVTRVPKKARWYSLDQLFPQSETIVGKCSCTHGYSFLNGICDVCKLPSY